MRKSGILMHISSLPGPYGIGTLGKSAYEFVDFLHAAGQSYWQILPLCPTGYGDSPYQSFSTFAGNPYFIDPDILVEQGLLTPQETDGHKKTTPRVDYGWLYETRLKLFETAFRRFVPGEDYERFLAKNSWWLDDYALFMALKTCFRGRPWQDWSMSLILRLPAVLEAYRKELDEDVRFHSFLQYQFLRQWEALRSYANGKGIKIIGDVPIYVPLDSADVWAEPTLFQLDSACRPKKVAGCPPDSFSAHGQLWGNPLYDWEKMKKNGYKWWLRRLSAAGRLYDVVRFDHFRGLESYWAVPAGEETAIHGAWEPGPGEDFIRTVNERLPHLEFIAEDLGFVTPQVRALQEFSGYPGMKVMQFAFDSREAGDYLPENYTENSVCYSGTHDNITLLGWSREAAPEDVEKAWQYLGSRDESFVDGMIRLCMESRSKLCVIQLQDWLSLGAEARMNTPGVLSGSNWTWRADRAMLTPALAARIRTTTQTHQRT